MAKYQIHLIFLFIARRSRYLQSSNGFEFLLVDFNWYYPRAFIECVETKGKEIFSLEIFAINYGKRSQFQGGSIELGDSSEPFSQ